MLSNKELESAISVMLSRIAAISRLFIRKVAEQIRILSSLNASSIHTLNVMADMGRDVAEITRELSSATAMNIRDTMKLYQRALDDAIATPAFRRYLTPQQPPGDVPTDIKPLQSIPPAARDRVTRLTQYVAEQTAGKMINLSNTTAISETYREYVDRGVTAVTTGFQSYDEARREIIREIGGNGLKVVYESGYRRRLDTAVRQNVLDGTRQIGEKASEMIAEELGIEARLIDAHQHSAPDHEPVQGRVFLKVEFDKMQAGQDFMDIDGKRYTGFRRPIGEWNCRHYVIPFDPEIQKRFWSNEQLDRWKKENAEGCEIEGKHYTLYQVTQYMRELETKVRRQKDIAVAAKEVGDMELRRECQEKIDAIARRYYQVANAAGLRAESERMSVEGFRRVKL